MEADDMGHAIAELIEARNLSPEEPEVIRATISYIKLIKGDRRELAYQLRLLSTKQPLSLEEQLLQGNCLVDLGRIDEARRIYDALPAGATEMPDALALLARLQAAGGQAVAAADSARKSRMLDKDSPDVRLQLAIENCRSAFPEIKQQAWRELWDLCQLPPPVGIGAARAILRDPRFTAEEAQRLLPIVEAHPHADLAVRLDIVSALIRFFPDRREELIRGEMTRFETEKKGTLIEMAAWLSSLGEHARLIALIPANLAASSRPLYTAIVKSLVSQGRWQELKKMLKERRPPVSNTLATLWLADAESHLQPDLSESRRLISFAIKAAINNGENEELELAAAFASRLEMHDLSLEAYQGLLQAVPARQNDFLKKLRSLALLTSNTQVLLDSTRQLKELNPDTPLYADEHTYFRLLLGQDIETVDIASLKRQRDLLSSGLANEGRIPVSLLEALAAFRFGDKTAISRHVARLPLAEGMNRPRLIKSPRRCRRPCCSMRRWLF
jgi:tetratricopeptide (TPR) repeat protein